VQYKAIFASQLSKDIEGVCVFTLSVILGRDFLSRQKSQERYRTQILQTLGNNFL